MFLLLLMGLGAAGVKAQVRIGGNMPPSAAAVLDLNASDAANTGKGGLVLPRVDLTSNTMPLTTGVANVPGTMVYNTTATLGATGVYFWNGNQWVMDALPTPLPTDSGALLEWNGNTWTYTQSVIGSKITSLSSIAMLTTPQAVTWSKIVDGTFTITNNTIGNGYSINIPGLRAWDMCVSDDDFAWTYLLSSTNILWVVPLSRQALPGTFTVHCYRPSL